LGSANFYRHFIDGFSKVARPLTALTAFNWAEAARSALVTSKHLFYRGAYSGALPPRKADGGRDRRKRFRAWCGSIANSGDQEAPSGGLSLEEIQASRDQLLRLL
jgi:hypothetical protein